MTTDLLFIELGAVVTKVNGPNLCTIEPYCDPSKPPTYLPSNCVEVNFAYSLGHVSPAEVRYDAIVHPASNRVQIGLSWPGGGYEGIVCVRENVVQQPDTILCAAANTLKGSRCRYQVITSIDGAEVRRYHGFWAQVVQIDNGIVFKLVNLDEQLSEKTITYNPADPNRYVKFYSGDGNPIDGYSIGNNIVGGSVSVGSQGAVFMNLDAFDPLDVTWIIAADPKQPPGAGL